MNARHRLVAAMVVALWGVLSVAVAWQALHGIDHAARSREALAQAAARRGHAPQPAWPGGIDARALAKVKSEERPLVLRTTAGEVVTAPVKDADDWDIIGVEVVRTRGGEQSMRVAAPVALAAMLLLIALVAWPPARRASAGATALVAGTLLLGAAALTSARLHDAQRALGALQPCGAAPCAPLQLSPALERMALQPPAPEFTALLLALVALGAALALGVVQWHAASAARPARVRETLGAWLFVAPSLAHLLVFTVAPALFLLWISVHDWDLLARSRPFVGLAHFREIGSDPLFWRALRNGLVFALYVPATMVAALAAALVLDQPLRGIKVLRVVVFLPYVASTVAVALVWQWLLHRDFGLLNAALAAVHLPRVDWLGNPRTALGALMLVSAWGQLGYMMVVYLAGLQAIPASLLEAARLDGASAWQRFRFVTWPMLRPVSVYLLLTGIIWSFHGFTLVYVMTEGGPSHATDMLVYKIYQTAWEFRRFDVAAAMSVVLCAMLLALTALQWRVLRAEPRDA